MIKRIASLVPALLLVFSGLIGTVATPAAAEDIANYTAFPPFLPRVVSPSILFMLDFSKSMVRPAYGECNSDYQDCRYKFVNPNDDYDATQSYQGYFNATKRYSCISGLNNTDQCTIDPIGQFHGNWLNWLAATQFDVSKKVFAGGHFTAAPETAASAPLIFSELTNETIPNTAPANQQNFTAPAQSVPKYREFYKVVEKQVCLDNAPDEMCDTTVPQRVPFKWIETPADATYLWKNQWVYDEVAKNITLPFTVPYFGENYTKANISDNGFIQLANDALNIPDSNFTNYDIPKDDSVDNLIAIWWDDLAMRPRDFAESADKESFVSYFTKGTTPNRILVITWNNLYPYAVTTSDRAVSFQMLIFEGDGQIVFQYKDVDGGLGNYLDNNTDKAKSATIGLENSTGTLGKKYYFGGWTDANSNSIQDPGETPVTGIVENSLALHMTYGYKVFRIDPAKTDNIFRPAGQTNTSPLTYHVRINTKKGLAAIKNAVNMYVCPESNYYPNQISGQCYDHETEGLIQEFRNNEPTLGYHLGVMVFNNPTPDGGYVIKHFNDTGGWTNTIVALRDQKPTEEAPIAEALHMAQGYFRQVDTNYNLGLTALNESWKNTPPGSVDCTATANNYDPFCFKSAAQYVPCAKNFVLLVSSGNYSHDFKQNVYGDAVLSADKTPYSGAVKLTPGETAGSNEGTQANGGWIDNVAYKMHTTDMRPNDMDGTQSVSLYAVNTFGSESSIGTAILKRAALFGGFKDVNSNGEYDAGEDDPSDPRLYDEARGDLKGTIERAINAILQNSASGTSVSVLSTSAGGEGALYQAYFYPAKIVNNDQERKWPGYLRAFLLDGYQQLRDDYSNGTPDATLNTEQDRVAVMRLNPDTSAVRIDLYGNTPKKLPIPAPAPTETATMDDVISMWEGGRKLAASSKDNRKIYLWYDDNNDGAVGNGNFDALGGEAMALVEGNAHTLRPYLRAVDDTESTNIINFIRGAEISGYRSRCLTVPGEPTETGCLASSERVWPLGDIIYSTPTLVGAPAEKFNLIYGDKSYFPFYAKYKDRRQMVYVGANDGMLHAFNGGMFDTTNVKFTANADPADLLPGLGDELWAFIPQESLPHLAWLACNGKDTAPATCGKSEYTHVYYVDHRPRVTDARIFSPDDIHPNGWGSVLILPLRLGGGAIDVTDDFGNGVETRQFRSAYYAFDVTVPDKPKLLWRFTDPNLGFTTSYPAIVRIGDKVTDNGKWFMVVGSGPKNDTGPIAARDYNFTNTSQNGRVFVVDLASGALQHTHVFPDATNAIMGDPVAVDVNIDFNTDVLYIGSAISTTSGRVYRINTANVLTKDVGGNDAYKGQPNPANWTYSTFFDPDFPAGVSADPTTGKDMGPLLVSPSVSSDSYDRLWVYFGTGRLKTNTDLRNSDQQRFYGIKDACWQNTDSAKCIADRKSTNPAKPADISNTPYHLADLFNSDVVKVTTTLDAADQVHIVNTTDQSAIALDKACDDDSSNKCSFKETVTNVQQLFRGWYTTLDNPAGTTPSERVLARSSVIGGLVLFTTYQPLSDMCSIFGNSALYALYYETGTASNSPVVKGALGVDGDFVRPKIDLGAGMPTSVGIAIGETVSGFVQKSTGEIVRIEANPALRVRSAITGWRESTGNTGNAGVETIYEHIVK